MIGAPELEDLNGAPSLLLLQGVAQDDDVIGDELLNAETGDVAVVLSPLGRHHSSHTHTFEGRGDAKKLAPNERVILETAEDGAQGVHRETFVSHLVHGALDAGPRS